MPGTLPVVLVHGIRLSGACWRQQRQLLGHRRVAAPDLPGHGNRREEAFSIDGAVGVVADAIDQVGGRAVVAGHSLGGYVAIATAAHHPDEVAALAGFGCTLGPSPVLRAVFRAAHRGLCVLPDGGDRLSARALRRVLPAEIADPVISAGIATDVIPAVMGATTTVRPTDELASYPGQVLLVNGRHDHFRLGERRFLAACHDGALQIVPGAGHYLPLTHGRICARILDAAATQAETPEHTPSRSPHHTALAHGR